MPQADDVQLRVLEGLQGAENYNHWLAELTQRHLGDDPVEIGSGLGGNAALWLEAGAPRVTVSDVDPVSLERLEQRFATDERVTVERIDLASAPAASHSSCVALNVLEHIEDDVGALRGAARLVRPGGSVVMFVPAFDFAAGRFDRAIGHRRRYTRDSIASVYEQAGLELASTRYVNAPGLVAWFVSVRLLGHTPGESALLRLWDRGVIPLVRRSESLLAPPFGQSVLAVGSTRA
jgi:SAM-dependent methyltransferase